MIPFPTDPAFVVSDDLPGKVRIIQGHTKEISMPEFSASVQAGVVTPTSNAIVLARRFPKRVGAVLMLSITSLDRGPGNCLQPRQRHDLLELRTRIGNESQPCDVALNFDESSGLISLILISYLNGIVERIECTHPEAQ